MFSFAVMRAQKVLLLLKIPGAGLPNPIQIQRPKP